MAQINYEEIELYLSDAMDEGTAAAFRARMETSAALRDAVTEYRHVAASLRRTQGHDALREILARQREGASGQQQPRRIRLTGMLRWSAAAGVLLATLLLWSPWQQDMLTQYGRTEMILPAERGSDTEIMLSEATALFNKGRYRQAAPLLETVMKERQGDEGLLFYYSVARLHSGHLQDARAGLIRVYEGQSVFKYDAAYFMALAELESRDRAACRQWLSLIPEDAPVYLKAEKLRAELD